MSEHHEEPPAWVQQDKACSRLWQQDATWRQNALLAGDNQATQRLLIKLAWRASGSSEGEAHES